MTTEDFVGLLDGVTRNGAGWTARCPAHDDHNPSLSVSVGADGRTLIKCHAGCASEDICNAVGRKPADLFPGRNGHSKRIVATYDYTDESGALLYQVVRYDPKDFRQRRPDPAGLDGWNWSTKGVRRVLYRLPKVRESIASGYAIFVCEGEKDCDALIQRGLTATCNSGGAGKWSDGYLNDLKGATEVVIIADKDEPGRKHAREVAASLFGRVNAVKVVELPDPDGQRVKDAFDWFSAGGEELGLIKIVEAAPIWSPSPDKDAALNWDQLLQFDTSSDPANLVGLRHGHATRYICCGYGAWLIGQSGIGKSSLATQIGASFSCGMSLWGITPARSLRVLIVQAENDLGDCAEMVQGVARAMGLHAGGDSARYELVRANVRVRTLVGTVGLAFCNWLRSEITQFQAELVIVDPLLAFAGCDLARTEQATTFLRVYLDPVLRDTGAAMIAVHHTGKPKQEKDRGTPTIYDLAYAGLGSSELVNWARAVMVLSQSGPAFRLTLSKRGKRAWACHPSGQPTLELWLRHGSSGIHWEQIDPPDEPEESGSSGKRTKPKSKSDFLAHVPPDGHILQNVLLEKANDAGIGQKKARAFLDELLSDGTLHVWLMKRKGTNPEKRISRTPQPKSEEAELTVTPKP